MSGPYGITQVDVPGALNVLEQARSNRIRQMMLQRQLDQDERAEERQTGIRAAFARYQGVGKASPTAAPAPATSSEVPDVTGQNVAWTPQPSAAAPPVAPAPAAVIPPAAGDRTALFNELLVLDHELAARTMTAFNQMDQAQLEQVSRRNGVMARAGLYLQSIPEAERAAELQRIAPELVAQGIPAEQINAFQPTDRNIQRAIAQARDVEKLVEDARPRLREVAGQVVDERMLPAATAEDPVVFESEFINTLQGVYRRSDLSGGGQAPPQGAPQPGDVRESSQGPVRFRGGDYRDRNNWEPVRGGAGQQGPQTFP